MATQREFLGWASNEGVGYVAYHIIIFSDSAMIPFIQLNYSCKIRFPKIIGRDNIPVAIT